MVLLHPRRCAGGRRRTGGRQALGRCPAGRAGAARPPSICRNRSWFGLEHGQTRRRKPSQAGRPRHVSSWIRRRRSDRRRACSTGTRRPTPHSTDSTLASARGERERCSALVPLAPAPCPDRRRSSSRSVGRGRSCSGPPSPRAVGQGGQQGVRVQRRALPDAGRRTVGTGPANLVVVDLTLDAPRSARLIVALFVRSRPRSDPLAVEFVDQRERLHANPSSLVRPRQSERTLQPVSYRRGSAAAESTPRVGRPRDDAGW